MKTSSNKREERSLSACTCLVFISDGLLAVACSPLSLHYRTDGFMFAKHGYKVVSMDISQAMVDLATKVKEEGITAGIPLQSWGKENCDNSSVFMQSFSMLSVTYWHIMHRHGGSSTNLFIYFFIYGFTHAAWPFYSTDLLSCWSGSSYT